MTSRKTHNKGISDSASTFWTLPLTFKEYI
jgi:hypothetical protein